MGIEHDLTHHKVDRVGIMDIEVIREKAKRLGMAMEQRCPPGRQRSFAITKLEESIMWAVKSIALEGAEQPGRYPVTD